MKFWTADELQKVTTSTHWRVKRIRSSAAGRDGTKVGSADVDDGNQQQVSGGDRPGLFGLVSG